MNENELQTGFRASMNYIDENKEPSAMTVYSNKQDINGALEELFKTAIRLNIYPKEVSSIRIEKDILFQFVENRLVMKRGMFNSVLRQWEYSELNKKNDSDKDENERVFKPVKITDQPFWMKEKSEFYSPFIDSGLHWYYLTTDENTKVKFKAGWLKNDGMWMAINLFTGEIEFSENFQITNLKSAIDALQKFTGDTQNIN